MNQAPIVEWIRHRPPKSEAQVQFLVGVQSKINKMLWVKIVLG